MPDKTPQNIEIPRKGIQQWTSVMADALGVTPDDIIRTSGCELEFLVTSEDEGAFRTRLNKLADGGYKARYAKNPDFMPVALQPSTWQKNLEMERAAAGSTKIDPGRVAE